MSDTVGHVGPRLTQDLPDGGRLVESLFDVTDTLQ